MANRDGHRRFGNVRRLPSGRYQASYLGLDGLRKYAPETFERKGDAERFLAALLASGVSSTVAAKTLSPAVGKRWGRARSVNEATPAGASGIPARSLIAAALARSSRVGAVAEADASIEREMSIANIASASVRR